MKTQVTVFGVVIPFSGLHTEDGGSMVLWISGILQHHYMASQLGRPWH